MQTQHPSNKTEPASPLYGGGKLALHFMSGSFAQYHFQLHYINHNFLLALGAIKRKFYKNRIRIDLRSCLPSTDRTMNPERILSIVAHFYTSNDGIALRQAPGFYLISGSEIFVTKKSNTDILAIFVSVFL